MTGFKKISNHVPKKILTQAHQHPLNIFNNLIKLFVGCSHFFPLASPIDIHITLLDIHRIFLISSRMFIRIGFFKG